MNIKENINKKQCWLCIHFKLPVPDPPHCAYHKIDFPSPKNWRLDKSDPEYAIAPGLRTCKHWE